MDAVPVWSNNFHAESRALSAIAPHATRLRPLQVGLAVRTADGKAHAWVFNLSDFDMLSDGPQAHRCAPASVAYLASRGVDFYRLKYDGVPGY
ncbi:hypothetical protein QOZ80_6AG0530770 [Eleusine coracana subsp. coracana]|nr:hypothetical protein QOZ80_6AG0530770 [Eleusine coracana subsp. coracana]